MCDVHMIMLKYSTSEDVGSAYLTVLSSEPEAAKRPSAERATDRTFSVCPSKVLSTPVVSRSQLLSVLSHDEDTMVRETPPCF